MLGAWYCCLSNFTVNSKLLVYTKLQVEIYTETLISGTRVNSGTLRLHPSFLLTTTSCTPSNAVCLGISDGAGHGCGPLWLLLFRILFIYIFFCLSPSNLLYKERETEEKKEIVARLKTPCTADPFLTPAIMHEAEGGVKVL